MQGNMFSGNFKNTFFVHEVEAGAEYTGLLVGPILSPCWTRTVLSFALALAA